MAAFVAVRLLKVCIGRMCALENLLTLNAFDANARETASGFPSVPPQSERRQSRLVSMSNTHAAGPSTSASSGLGAGLSAGQNSWSTSSSVARPSVSALHSQPSGGGSDDVAPIAIASLALPPAPPGSRRDQTSGDNISAGTGAGAGSGSRVGTEFALLGNLPDSSATDDEAFISLHPLFQYASAHRYRPLLPSPRVEQIFLRLAWPTVAVYAALLLTFVVLALAFDGPRTEWQARVTSSASTNRMSDLSAFSQSRQ